MTNRNIKFGGFLKAGVMSIAHCERTTAPIVEESLGELINVSAASIQRYKTGYIPPNINHVKILAIEIVKRGFLNKEWMHKFLNFASYPNSEDLVNKVFPNSNSTTIKPKHIYHNLPAPLYNEFIMRSDAFIAIANGLEQRSAVVLLISLGGMGKTSLAREVSEESISKEPKYKKIVFTPNFNSCVWISDSSNAGSTTLSGLLDEIAFTLNYSDLSKLPFEPKKRQISNLLRQQKVLIIIDNLESINDTTLIEWILTIPEPSKVLVTTREYRREFRNNTFVIELKGMNNDQALLFCKSHLIKLGLSESTIESKNLISLIEVAGGNPKAIEISLGYIKYEHKKIREVINDLYNAKGEIFDDLFAKCWSLLNENAKKALLSMYLFPFGTNRGFLVKTLGINNYELGTALEFLTDLSLIDVIYGGKKDDVLYVVHPLVRAFSKSKFSKLGDSDEIIQNWISLIIEISSSIGFAWNNISRLNVLDSLWLLNTIEYVVEWCFKNKQFDQVIQITKNIRYYYYVRGIWDTNNNLIRAKSAKKNNNIVEEFDALTYHVNIASKQANHEEVQKYLPRLKSLRMDKSIPVSSIIDFRHALALNHLYKNEYKKANHLWQINLREKEISLHSELTSKKWSAISYFRAGRLKESRELLIKLLKDSQFYNFKRGVLSVKVTLSSIELKEGNYNCALKLLDESIQVGRNMKDRTILSQIYYQYGIINFKKNKIKRSIEWLEKAIEEYKRIGAITLKDKVSTLLKEIKNHTK